MISPDPMPSPDCSHCERTKFLATCFEDIHKAMEDILLLLTTLVKTQQVMNDVLIRLADLIEKEPSNEN